MPDFPLDQKAALDRLLRFLAVEGVTGQERAIAEEVVAVLRDVGLPWEAIHFDQANERIPLPSQTGNLIVTLPGTMDGPRRLFMTHLDTVPLCAGAIPVKKGNRIVPKDRTALGGDNRTGVGVLVTLAATLVKHGLPHPPLTMLFTVREESGLWGARNVDLDDLGRPAMGFNVDGSSPRDITIGATGAERWEVEILGKAAHAGGHPERGISSSAVFALGLADVVKGGWFGKIKKAGIEGTSNVGPIGDGKGGPAGGATNVVTDYLKAHGESRSHDTAFNRRITQAYKEAFQKAAQRVTDQDGKQAKVKFTARRDYYPFRLKESAPVVRAAQAAAQRVGWEPTLKVTNGGLDANWLVRLGVPTITLGAGQNNVHTVEEFVDLPNYFDGCRYALALAVAPSL